MISYPNVKLNLGLHVIRKRPDGFHDLETLFVPYFPITDILEITAEGRSDCSEGAALPNISAATEGQSAGHDGSTIEIIGGGWDPQTDLCWRALQLLKADFDIPEVHIKLTKRAPVGAGLGSGSSDAAFTLRMLNTMFGLGLDDSALAACAARLGSDCAFFIYNRPMIGEGRGEMLSPYDIDLSAYDIRVEIPQGVAVSTKEAYSGIKPHLPENDLRMVLSTPPEQWSGKLVNDFETTVFAVHPEIAALKRRLYDEGAVYAAMSGSGSAVFGIFEK